MEEPISYRNLLEAVFRTSTLGLHVLESVRDENHNIIDFNILLTNAMSDKIAGRKVSGMRMLEGWPHTKKIGLFDKFISTVETGVSLDYEEMYEGDGVTAWFHWLASKFNDGLYVTIEDITYRKKDEAALQKTAVKLQGILDGVPAIMALLEVVYDKNNKPVDFVISLANNAMALFSSFTVDQLIGKSITDLYPETFRGDLIESYLKVFKTGEPLDFEFFSPERNRWFSVFVTKQTDGTGLIAVALDITEKKRVEEEQRKIQALTSLDKIKTEFFNNISHEFRTPLTLLLGPIEDMMTNKSIPKFQLNKLEMAHRNALRLKKLVNSLLDFAKIEAGRFDTVFQPTDLCEFTELLAGNFRSAIEKAGLKFIVNCESIEPVYVNRNMWEKVVLNLLSNAFKFTFKGSIEIRVKSIKRHIQLHVRDSGIGISRDNLSKIFLRFVRIESTKARTYEGSGIGLALVKELVSMHGGTIKVKSKVGSGSEFIVSIPKGKKHLPPYMIYEFNDNNYNSALSESYKQEAISWLPIRQPKIDAVQDGNTFPLVLLVDDNSDLREYIKDVLKYNFTIVEAINGRKAIELLNNGVLPELIIADIMMPEMNGFELLQAVKQIESLINIPFIFLSAKASEEDRIEGLRSGVDHYLIKPFSSNELLETVKSKIRTHHRRLGKPEG